MGKLKKKKNSIDRNDKTDTRIDREDLNEVNSNRDFNKMQNEKTDDDSLINFLIENDSVTNQIDLNDRLEEEHENRSTNSANSEDEDEENRYNGRVLNRKEYFEQIYLKYAKDLYSSKNDKIAKSLRKKIKVVLGEGKDKNFVFVNDEPIEIEQRICLNYKNVIAFQLTKTRLGFSYFCAYYDERFNRICFQPFKDKKEVVDHYYSLHLNKLKNYYCDDENCRKSYVFHKQMKGHLIREHGIYSDFDQHFTPISYYFETRCQVKHIKDKDSMKVYQNRLIEKP